MSEFLTLEIVESRGVMRDEDGWRHYAYRVRLRFEGRSMTIPFRTGIGWDREPTAADVLECVLSDSAGYENAADDAARREGSNFESWAGEYGYELGDAEVRARAWRTFNQCGRQAVALERLLRARYEAAIFPTVADDYSHEVVAARLTGSSVTVAAASCDGPAEVGADA